MARKERLDLEIRLQKLELFPQKDKKESRHLLSVSLIWPRVLIPQRNALRPLVLSRGSWGDNEPPSWCRSILFKETVEGAFGLQCTVSSPLPGKLWQKASRSIAAGAIHIGADLLEDALPAPAGKFAALPVDFLAGQIKDIPEPPILGITEKDLEVSLFAEKNELLLSLPLLAEHTVTHMIPKGPPRDRRYTRQTLFPKDSQVGTVTLTLKVL